MVNKYLCKTVDMTFFDTAPFRYIAEVEVKASAEDVFASFENADDWPRWAMPIQKVEWTAPTPFGIGTTRTVSMVGGLVGYEEFIAWEPGREMAFCFTHGSKDNIESFAERYEVSVVNEQYCRVRWTMAMKPKGFSKYFLPVFSPAMHLWVKVLLRKFARLVEGRRASA